MQPVINAHSSRKLSLTSKLAGTVVGRATVAARSGSSSMAADCTAPIGRRHSAPSVLRSALCPTQSPLPRRPSRSGALSSER